MMQYSKTDLENTGETDGKHPANWNAITANISLYAGTGVFYWSIDAYVERRVELSITDWYITLHVTAHGGGKPMVFRSENKKIEPGSIAFIPFLITTVGSIQESSYGMPTIRTQFNDGATIVSDTIGVMFTVDGGHPVIKIVDTEITSTWLIGAREIVLTDPPIES